MKILNAISAEHMDSIRTLFREYESSLGVDLCFQSFEEELKGLPGKYAPPDGVLLMALSGQEPAGCCALRKLEEGVCEMKRLYVRPEFRGQGLGRNLADSIVNSAVGLGYDTMLLDTLDRLKKAMVMYESMGFERTVPYYSNPLPGVVYWRLDLTQSQKS
jgi:putative acetyltransferase